MDHQLAAIRDVDRDDVARNSGGEGDLSGTAVRTVFGHEEAAATGDAADGTEESSAAAHLRVCGQLDIAGHPGELAGLGDDGVVGFENEFKDRHGGADDATLHEVLLGRGYRAGAYER